MCFSTSASFTASAGLLVIGAVTIYQSKNTQQRVLATIPVIFSVQQFCEGLLWLSLSNAAYVQWREISMYTFLVFAQVVWPIMVPFTILLFETNPARKKLIGILLGAGAVTASYLTFCFIHYDVNVVMQDHHIRYEVNFPLLNRWYSGIPYLLATILSPFVSSKKHLRLFGCILLGSYLFSRFMYQDYLTSVWCYFAAVLSLFLVFIIRQLNKPGGVIATA